MESDIEERPKSMDCPQGYAYLCFVSVNMGLYCTIAHAQEIQMDLKKTTHIVDDWAKDSWVILSLTLLYLYEQCIHWKLNLNRKSNHVSAVLYSLIVNN